MGHWPVIQNLWERVVRADPGIVSPRKRILRELERVTLEDQNNSKRQRARPSPEQPKPVSSHSINSILAREDEPSFLRSLLRSSPPAETLPTPVHHPPPIHPLYPYPSPSYAPPVPAPTPAPYYSPLPSYRGSPSIWAMHHHHYPLSGVRSSYPVPSYPPVTTPPWSLPYQPIDVKRDDCTSGLETRMVLSRGLKRLFQPAAVVTSQCYKWHTAISLPSGMKRIFVAKGPSELATTNIRRQNRNVQLFKL
ncbi:hypothetical protein J6590_039087 [Homalodisca vitripennis]|nr:hypothetical protein J6590_039087 [Homalodisca vitripennis]